MDTFASPFTDIIVPIMRLLNSYFYTTSLSLAGQGRRFVVLISILGYTRGYQGPMPS